MMQLSISSTLEKAEREQGLTPEEVRFIFDRAGEGDWEKIFFIAREITLRQFQKKIYFFAPLYFSNYCINDCVYCGFQRSNRLLKRRSLSESEFLQEARFLWKEGHRSLLLIAGEHPVYGGTGQIASYVCALKREKMDVSLAMEIGPLETHEYKFLSEVGVLQVLLFQETYDRETYERIHQGRKADYDWRFEALERALCAGMKRVGLGILLGLYDYRDDFTELVRHAWHLKQMFGDFSITFSFPRLRPAEGIQPFNHTVPISDTDYEKIVALARLAFPSAGIVLTTRETPVFRRRLLELGIGVTHMSAGSVTQPGGYVLEKKNRSGQFNLLDRRSLRNVACESKTLGYKPIFHLNNFSD